MPVLLSDARVRDVALRDNGEPLVSLTFAPAALVRTGLAERLVEARAALPLGIASAIAWLASPESHLVQGAVIPGDGGWAAE